MGEIAQPKEFGHLGFEDTPLAAGEPQHHLTEFLQVKRTKTPFNVHCRSYCRRPFLGRTQ
jgi:hypothetical protein